MEESVRSISEDEEIPDLPPLIPIDDPVYEVQGKIDMQETIADEKDEVTPESMIVKFLSKVQGNTTL